MDGQVKFDNAMSKEIPDRRSWLYNNSNLSYPTYSRITDGKRCKDQRTLPPEMVYLARDFLDAGEYASSSEVVRDALRE